jgi:hypothetical protein
VGFLQQMGHLWEELRHGLAALRQRLWSCLPYGAASASPLELLSCATILQSSDAPQERRLLAMVILMLADMQLHAPSLIACRVASLVGAIALQGSWYILLLVVIFPTFPPVRKRPAGASEETAERAEEAGVDRLARLKQRCGYCGLCQSVIRDLTGHCSRRPQCKHNPGTRKLTEAEMAALVSEFHEEQKDPEVAKRKRVEQAKAKHEQEWKPPSGSPVSHGPYCLQFGKHAKKTVSEVAAADPGYFPHLMASSKGKILTTWPGLKEALASEGLLDNLVQNLPDRMREGAERVLLRAEEQQHTHPKIHPEIQKLRRLQQIAASQTLDESQKGEALASLPAVGKEDVAEGSLRKKRRRTLRSTAMRLLPHCRVCGAIAHKEPTCPYKDEDQAGPRRRRGIQWFLNKKLAEVVSRLKYTPVDTRPPSYQQRPRALARAPLQRSFKQLIRAPAGQLSEILEQDGLIVNAKGVPCPRDKCERAGQQEWRSDEKVLGKRCVAKEAAPDINIRSVWHRCRSCGIKQSIGIGNPLFEGFIGKGSLGLTPAVCAFWNCVEQVSATQTARQLGVSEDAVS